MANIAFNDIYFDVSNFEGGVDTFIEYFFDEVDEYTLVLMTYNPAQILFSDEVVTKFAKGFDEEIVTLEMLLEKISEDLDKKVTVSDVQDAMDRFQRYADGERDDEDDDQGITLTGVGSKADISFELFYVFAMFGVTTQVDSVDEFGEWFREGYEVTFDGDVLVEKEDEYFDLSDDESYEKAQEKYANVLKEYKSSSDYQTWNDDPILESRFLETLVAVYNNEEDE